MRIPTTRTFALTTAPTEEAWKVVALSEKSYPNEYLFETSHFWNIY